MALSADRNSPRFDAEQISGGVAASVLIYAGAIVMRNATGFLTKGQTALNLVGVGRSEQRVTGGAGAGDVKARVRPGIFRFKNSAAADEITIAEIGKPFYVVDDETVAKTSGTNTRSIGGFVHDVDAQGVLCRFDETLVQAYLAGITLPA